MVVVSLALGMPNLYHFEVYNTNLVNGAVWPAFAACSNLMSLSVCEGRLAVTEVVLRHLSRATQLEFLELDSDTIAGLNNGELQRFLAGMPRLHRIDWM